jgi:hypothetical protein
MSSNVSAVKHDQDKLRFDLLSVPALSGMVAVLTKGAKKYSDHNWRKGFKWSRLYASALRHIFLSLGGQSRDPEFNESHVDMAMACLMMLSEHEKLCLGEDDRYRGEPRASEVAASLMAEAARVQKVMKNEGVRRKTGPKGLKAERVLVALKEPLSIAELARALSISSTGAGHWIHKLKDRLVVEEGKDAMNRRVVRYAAR